MEFLCTIIERHAWRSLRGILIFRVFMAHCDLKARRKPIQLDLVNVL